MLGVHINGRTRARAVAATRGAALWPFECMAEALQQADLVVSCTAAPEIVIDADMVARALAGRGEPLLLLDLAISRDFVAWWAAQAVTPTIRALQAHAEAIRITEFERTLAKLPALSSHEQNAVCALSAAIVNKILHARLTSLNPPAQAASSPRRSRRCFSLAWTVNRRSIWLPVAISPA
jgi:glutamyl-tRNA reductase